MCNAHNSVGTKTLNHPDPEALYRRQFLKYVGAGDMVAAGGAIASCTKNAATGRS